MSSLDQRQREIDAAWDAHNARGHGFARQRTQRLKWRLAEAQNWRCCWCGRTMDPDVHNHPAEPTFEHIIPRSMGGPDVLNNLAIACNACNNSRPSTTEELDRVLAMFLRET